MNRVLVLGASGLVGQNLCHYLKKSEYEILTHSFSKDGFDYKFDTSDKSQLEKMILEARPDIIINLVALANVDACEESPTEAFRLNVKTCENLSTINSHIIHISTDQVYDGNGTELNKEEDVTLSNYYAFSKYMGELVLSNAGALCLRCNFFGPAMDEAKKGLSDWLFDNFKSNTEITLFPDVYFSPLCFETFSEIILRLIPNFKPGVYNLGSLEGLSKKDFALEFAKVLEFSPKYISKSVKDSHLKTYRPSNMLMDSTKFQQTFKYKLPTLREEIKKMRGYYEGK